MKIIIKKMRVLETVLVANCYCTTTKQVELFELQQP